MRVERKGIRGGTRIPIELPVSVRWKNPSGTDRHIEAKTGNISGNGLFILTAARLRRDTPVQFTVLLPPRATQFPTELHGQGRVVRQHARGATMGVGVVIDDYELLCAQHSA